MSEQEKQRVAIFIFPETRQKLNLVKAQLSRREGKTVFLDEAINALIDSGLTTDTPPVLSKRSRVAQHPVPTP